MGAQFGKTQGNEERGYVEQEFFFTGSEPEYTTRLVVNRPMVDCVDPLNGFPSLWVYSAALDWLDRWVRDGERPESGPGLQMESKLDSDRGRRVPRLRLFRRQRRRWERLGPPRDRG